MHLERPGPDPDDALLAAPAIGHMLAYGNAHLAMLVLLALAAVVLAVDEAEAKRGAEHAQLDHAEADGQPQARAQQQRDEEEGAPNE